ncbi:MAG: MerR family transcriptional regulator [Sphingomonadales bacterium]|nr:MerR family transcriptional regulator [Sphingomonadales bacterium]
MGAKPIKSPEAFRTISEVADDLAVPQHVLRFWETKFAQIKPMKRSGGRRYYRPEDLELLRAIKSLLYDSRLTIRGVQKLLREKGAKAVIASLHQAEGVSLLPSTASRTNGTAVEPHALRAILAELEDIRRLLIGETTVA